MSENSLSWDDLEYVRAEPPMVCRSAIGDLESGRCAVAYPGAAGRCTGPSEYKTTIKFNDRGDYVPLCEQHAKAGIPEEFQ